MVSSTLPIFISIKPAEQKNRLMMTIVKDILFASRQTVLFDESKGVLEKGATRIA
jgi:hypothetical protein